MDQSSEESTDSKESASNSHGNASSKTTKNEKILIRRVIAKLVSKDENEMAQPEERQKQVNEVDKLEKTTRAKSVGRGTSERCRRSSSIKTERSKSMARSERKSELSVTTDRSESNERENCAMFHTKMIGMDRDNFIRENLGLEPRYFIKETPENKMSQDRKRNGRSRSRSGEKDNQHSRKRWREESGEYREYRRYRDKSYADLREDSIEYREYRRHAELTEYSHELGEYRRYRDKSHAELKEDSHEIKEQSRYGEHSSAERKEEVLQFKEQGHYSDQYQRRYGVHSSAERREESLKEQGHYGNHYHAECIEERHESREYGRLGDQRHAERKKETPCEYFNDVGFCKYESGHPGRFSNRKLHICAVCYYERGLKRDHPQVDCNHSVKKTTSRNDCKVVDDACMHFNNGDCRYKSGGHVSRDGKYVRLHICEICFKYGEKRSHPAIECKYNESLKKHPKDSTNKERFESKTNDRHDSQKDKKPCSFFNIYGNCRYTSGHGGFSNLIHICSCCLEFLGEARNHSAIDCHLKKVLVGERTKFVVGNPELPCNNFNSGHCDLKSGHHLLRGDLRVFHICKFCFEYRGEKNSHTREECKLRKKLLQEVEGESRSKYADSKKDVRREKETGNEELKSKIPKEITEKKSSSRFTEEPGEHSKEGNQAAKVKPEISQPDNLKESGQLKTANGFKVCLIKRKSSKASDKCSSISSCRQKEEAINQTVSKINEDVEHDMEVLVKEDSNTEGLIPVDRDLEEAKQDAYIGSDEEKYANPPKTFLNNKEQESGSILSSGPIENDHRKLNDHSLLPRKQFQTIKEEHGNKRRKLERMSPQAVTKLDGGSDGADKSKLINEKEKLKHCDKGLLPVDDVLKSLNGEVLQLDPETKTDVNEILKKLEKLENLHTIEVENLRKARQHSKKVIGDGPKSA